MKKIITSILVATSLASLFLNTNDLLGTTRSFFDTSSIVVAFLFLMALLVKNLPNKNCEKFRVTLLLVGFWPSILWSIQRILSAMQEKYF